MGANVCAICRTPKFLQNEYLLLILFANIGLDAAENELSEVSWDNCKNLGVPGSVRGYYYIWTRFVFVPLSKSDDLVRMISKGQTNLTTVDLKCILVFILSWWYMVIWYHIADRGMHPFRLLGKDQRLLHFGHCSILHFAATCSTVNCF